MEAGEGTQGNEDVKEGKVGEARRRNGTNKANGVFMTPPISVETR